jgi:hypothetical protein
MTHCLYLAHLWEQFLKILLQLNIQMFKILKKTKYFDQQMKLNGKNWDAFQSNLVNSCAFFGTFNAFMAEFDPGIFNQVYGGPSKLILKQFKLILRNCFLVSSVLFNSEVWYNVTEAELNLFRDN